MKSQLLCSILGYYSKAYDELEAITTKLESSLHLIGNAWSKLYHLPRIQYGAQIILRVSMLMVFWCLISHDFLYLNFNSFFITSLFNRVDFCFLQLIPFTEAFAFSFLFSNKPQPNSLLTFYFLVLILFLKWRKRTYFLKLPKSFYHIPPRGYDLLVLMLHGILRTNNHTSRFCFQKFYFTWCTRPVPNTARGA